MVSTMGDFDWIKGKSAPEVLEMMAKDLREHPEDSVVWEATAVGVCTILAPRIAEHAEFLRIREDAPKVDYQEVSLDILG